MNDETTKLSALIIASVSSFLTPFMISSVNIALPAVGREFETDAVLLSWVATSYLLAAAVSLVPFGKLADIHGRKKIFLSGQIIVTITSLLAAISGSAIMLIVFRIFQGVGGAMVFATGIAILTSVYPPRERGKVLGIAVAAVYIGLSCGPFFGGWLTQHFSWRSIFLVNIPLGLTIILLVVWKLKGEWAGAVLIAQPIVMAVFSPLAGRLSDKIEPRVISSLGMALTTLGLILLALISHHTTLLYVVISLLVLGFGFALFSSPNMNAIMSSVPKKYYGIASGTVGTMRVLGQMLSMGIATLVIALFIGRVTITPELYPLLISSIKIAFIISACLCATGVFFSLYRGELRSEN